MEKVGAFKFIATFAVVSILGSMFTALPAVAFEPNYFLKVNRTQDSGVFIGDTNTPRLNVLYLEGGFEKPDKEYRQVIFDEFNGISRFVDVCYIEETSSCEVDVNNSTGYIEPGVHNYTVYLDESNEFWGFDNDVIENVSDLENNIASSNTFSWTKRENSFSLSGNSNFFANDWSAPYEEMFSQLTLQFSENPLTTDYAYYIFDVTNNELIDIEWYIDGSDQTVFSVPTEKNDNQIRYQAFLASSKNEIWKNVNTVEDLVDVQFTSNAITKTRRPWIVHPITEGWNGGAAITYFAGGGRKSVYLEDKTTKEILWSSQGNEGNSEDIGNNGHPEGDLSWARAIVADPWDENSGSRPTQSSQLSGVIADSDGLKDNVFMPGIQDKEQIAGGYNPSEMCKQTCAGDPINVYTGEFFDSETDLMMTGKVLTPSATRHFSTQKKDELNLMGYGWRNSYEMSVETDTEEPVSSSSRVKVVQENGSASFFDRQQDGTFTPQGAVQATLKYDASTGWSFTRDKRDAFKFDLTGKLVSIKDIHGNELNVSYSNNRIAAVSDSTGNLLTFHYNTAGLISRISASNGRETIYAYTNKNLVSVTNEKKVLTGYTYDTKRRVKTLRDTLGGVTENFYNSENRVIRQDNPLDQQLLFSYENTDGMAQTTTITHPDGSITSERYSSGLLIEKREKEHTESPRVWRYSYDKSSNLASTIAPDGSSESSFYDDEGNKTRHITSDGGEYSFTYDSMDNVITAKNPLGHTMTNTYDSKGNLLSSLTPEGHKTTFQWNPDGTLKSTVDARGNKNGATADQYKTLITYTGKGLVETVTSPLSNKSKMSYDSVGRATSATMPKGTMTAVVDDYTISSSYNSLDLPASVTDQKGNVTSMTYDNAGNVLTTTNELGNIATHTYDLLGRLKTSTTEDGTSSFTYDAAGRILTSTDNLGNVVTNTYDEWGNLVKITDSMGSETSFVYDKMNRVLSMTGPTGEIAKTRYDISGRAVVSIDPSGNSSFSSYNKANQLVSKTDEEGRTTRYSYDQDGYIVQVTNPDGSVISQTYDPVGNMVSRVDGEGSIEEWTFDSENRSTSYTDAEGNTETYEYDANSNQSKKVRVDGSVILSAYDHADFPTDIDYPGSDSDLSYSYDELNRIVGESKNGATTATSYDHAGRVLSRGTPNNMVSYSYDANGRQTSIVYPSGRKVEYEYDANGNMVSLQTADVGATTFSYDERGILSSSVLPNGVVETRTTDEQGQTTGIDISNATQQLHEVVKSYTPSGNIQKSDYGIVGKENRVEESYSHDVMNRTTSITSTLPGSDGQNAYNKAGHMTKFEGVTSTLDKIGKPLTVGTKSLGYDSLGNRISEIKNNATSPERTLAWEESGLLNSVDTLDGLASSKVNYDYTADGLLSERGMDADSDGFVWDANASNALMLSDGDYEYVYGPNRVPLAQINQSTMEVRYLHTDANGSVIATTGEDGFLLGITSYGAYGKRQGSPISNFGFAGEWTDPETGYVFLRARWYDPSTGNFVSKDPIAQLTQESYGYAGGNPLVRIDPSGMYIMPIGFIEKTSKTYVENETEIRKSVARDLYAAADSLENTQNYIEDVLIGAPPWLYENSGWISSGLGIASIVAASTVVGLPLAPILSTLSIGFGILSVASEIKKCGTSAGCDVGAILVSVVSVASGGAVGLVGKMPQLTKYLGSSSGLGSLSDVSTIFSIPVGFGRMAWPKESEC